MKYITILMFLASLTGCSQERLTDYKTPIGGFSFSYNNLWEKQLINNQPVFLTKGDKEDKTNFRNNLNVIVQDLSQNSMSLENFHRLTLQQMEKALGQKTIKSDKNVLISGIKGKELIYSIPKDVSKGNFLELKLKQVYFLKDNKAYIITYTSKASDFDKYLKSANIFFETFKLIGGNGTD